MTPSIHMLTEEHVGLAFERAAKGQRTVVALPPGYGKTYGTVQALRRHPGPLKVLWFMPETHASSLAAATQRQLHEAGVDALRLHRRLEAPAHARRGDLTWPAHTHVKLLAHAYLPLLFGTSPSSSLKALLEADLIVVDENPFGSLLTLSGTYDDRLPGHGTLALPLQRYLEELDRSGLLSCPAEAAYAVLARELDRAPTLTDDRQQTTAYLNDEGLARVMIRMLNRPDAATTAPFGETLTRFWNVARSGQASARRYASVYRHVQAVRRNLQALLRGDPVHGMALVRFPGSPEILVRNATLEGLDFGHRGVLHLDAFPHPLLLSTWLPGAVILPVPAALGLPGVTVEALVPEHAHDIVTIERKAVRAAESQARHHAVLQSGLQVLGERVVILAHQRLARQFGADLERDYAPHTKQAAFLYWRANLGLNVYAGWDAFIVNESRLPRRLLHLDYTAVTSSPSDRQTILEHLEASDFLQLLHRTRPLLHGGRVLVAFDPQQRYSSALLKTHLTVRTLPFSVLRGKSEHVLALQAARIVVAEALAAWDAVPMRLLHLLFRLHPRRPGEAWDEELTAFLDGLRQRHRSFEWLELKSNPSDRQDRSLIRLLRDELGLTGSAQAIPGQGRGRPPLSWIWSLGADEVDVHLRTQRRIRQWYQDHWRGGGASP